MTPAARIKDGEGFDFREDQQPRRRETAVRGGDRAAVRGAAAVSGGAGVPHRRTSGIQSGRGGADRGDPPRV